MQAKNSRGETIIEKSGPLHKGDGSLACPGYAFSPLLEYRRRRIKASKWRIKEWDYYLINDDDYAVALTLGDMGYLGLISISLIDLVNKTYKTTSTISPFPFGRFHMPETSEKGVSQFENGRVSMRFEVENDSRRLRATFKKFDGNEDFSFDAILSEIPHDSMVIATPWKEDKLAFYYNQKIVAMRARGSFRKGKLVHGFNYDNSFGLLDWGRGVWTRNNTWFWACAQGWQDNKCFGLNLGYGFGDTSAASENMVFIDGQATKLGRVGFGIPIKNKDAAKIADRYDLALPWHVTDDENRLDLVFTPVLDRIDYMDYKLVFSDQHQVFGTFDGHVVLDDGSVFDVRALKGSAEVIHNVY